MDTSVGSSSRMYGAKRISRMPCSAASSRFELPQEERSIVRTTEPSGAIWAFRIAGPVMRPLTTTPGVTNLNIVRGCRSSSFTIWLGQSAELAPAGATIISSAENVNGNMKVRMFSMGATLDARGLPKTGPLDGEVWLRVLPQWVGDTHGGYIGRNSAQSLFPSGSRTYATYTDPALFSRRPGGSSMEAPPFATATS